MKLKTYEKGIYVRLVFKNEFRKPTKLERMFNIALQGKDEGPYYHIVYFKRNDTVFSNFDESIELLAGNYYVEGELINIVDGFNSDTSFFDNEVVITEDCFKVEDKVYEYTGSIDIRNEDLLQINFRSKSEDSFFGTYRFIAKK